MKQFLRLITLAVLVSGCTVTANDLAELLESLNQLPEPTAPDIIVKKGETGTSQIAANDRDVTDTHTYEITTPPAKGKATVSATGIVSYTAGEDLGNFIVEVTVTDLSGGTGKVAISVAVGDPSGSGTPGKPITRADPALAPFCGDGTDRALIKAISPSEDEILQASTAYNFVANVAYAVSNVPYTVELRGYAGVISWETITEPGCGTVSLRGTFTTPAGTGITTISAEPYSGQVLKYKYGYADATEFAAVAWESFSHPLDQPVDGLTVTIQAVISFDLYGDVGDPNASYAEWSADSANDYLTVYWYPTVSQRTIPVTVRSILNCGDTYVNFYWGANGQGSVDWNETWVSLQAVPPKIAIDNFYEGIPLNGDDEAIQNISIRACDSQRDFTVTPSAPWMSVDVSDWSLTAGSAGDLQLTLFGAQVPGNSAEGTLLVAANDGSWSYEIPVSVRKFNFDFSEWQGLGITGGDDTAGQIDLVNFTFPAEGVEYTSIFPETNGLIALGSSHEWYEAFDGPFNPGGGYGGMPMFALMYSDNGMFGYDDYGYYNAVYPDVFYREVNESGEWRLEILFWDQDSYDDVLTHNVILVNLYQDGTSDMRFLLKQTSGHETIGWWHSDGSVASQLDISTIRESQTIRFGAIE